MAARSPPTSWCVTSDSRPRYGTRPSMPSGTSLSSESTSSWRVPVLGVRAGLAAGLHRAERAHPAVGLVLLAGDEDQLTGRLGDAGQQRAEHHRVRADRDRLGDVAGVLQPAVADHRDSRPGRQALAASWIAVTCGHADPGDHPGGADRAGTDADLDRVRAGVDQRLRARPGRDVAADDVHPRADVAAAAGRPSRPRRSECPCAVSTMSTSTPASTSAIARLYDVLADADRGAAQQPAVGVLGGVAGTARS